MAAYTVMWEYKTVTKLLLLQALVKREKSVWLICYFGLMYKRWSVSGKLQPGLMARIEAVLAGPGKAAGRPKNGLVSRVCQ